MKNDGKCTTRKHQCQEAAEWRGGNEGALGLRNNLGFRYEEMEGMRVARGLHPCPPFSYLKRNLFLNYLLNLYFLLF
jgi:hypothetical protein